MLFIFDDESEKAFWMKNTLIPLDMVWISNDLEIAAVAKNVPPCKTDPCPSYSSEVSVKYVLEVNAGLAEELGWKVGDKVVLS